MAILTTPTVSETRDKGVAPKKTFSDQKRWISNLFYQELNRHTTTEDGDYATKAQIMIGNVINMAIDPDKDDYVKLAATKFITEHLEGKASTMTEERHEEMPKIVICVGDVSEKQLQTNIESLGDSEPKDDILVAISDEDGNNKQEYLG